MCNDVPFAAPQCGSNILALEERWTRILAEHDRRASGPDEADDLGALSDALHDISVAAAQLIPTCGREAAVLQRMALVEMGVSAEDDDPAAQLSYVVLRFLERAAMALIATLGVGVVTRISRIEDLSLVHFLA